MAFIAQEEQLDDEDIGLQHNGPTDFPLSEDTEAESETDLSLGPERERLYASLNVAKDATESEIRDNYRRLSRMFHPDKHSTTADRERARVKFDEVQQAYEVLTDPGRRAVYDSLGEKGLSTIWTVSTRIKSPDEIRQEYQRQIREKTEQEVDNLVRAKGTVSMTINGNSLLRHPPASEIISTPSYNMPKRQSNLLSSFTVRHAFSIPLPELQMIRRIVGLPPKAGDEDTTLLPLPVSRSSLGITAFAGIRGTGAAVANLVATFRTTNPKTSYDISCSALPGGQMIGTKVSHSFSEKTMATVNTQLTSLKRPPSATLILLRRLSLLSSGSVTFSTGVWSLGSWGPSNTSLQKNSSLTLQYNRLSAQKKGKLFNVQVTTGLMNTGIAAEYSIPFGSWIDSGYALKAGVVLASASGLEVRAGVERQLTQHTKVDAQAAITMSGGTTLRLGWMRLGQRVNIPIQMTSAWDLEATLWGIVVPCVTLITVDLLIVRPWHRRTKLLEANERRERHHEQLASLKRKAQDEVKLLEVEVKRRQNVEENKSGLVILEARYGVLRDPTASINVTIPVAALMHNSGQLVIPEGYSKSRLAGFYDPAYGRQKTLYIRYSFRKHFHEIEIRDRDGLTLPMEAHKVG